MTEPLTEVVEQSELDEVIAEMAKNEQDPEQCNEETGRYNREFLYNVRDLEQLCSVTECPLKPHELTEFGICRSDLSKNSLLSWYWQKVHLIERCRATVAKNKQDFEQCNEETGWYNREFLYSVRDLQKLHQITCPVKCKELKNYGIWYCHARFIDAPMKYRKPTVSLAKCRSKIPEELLKPLHKADHPWKLEKLNDDSDEARKETLIRQVRALLNKITTTTEKELTLEFLDYRVYQSPALKEIVSIIVNFALEETFCELFTRLCYYQITDECANSGDNHSTFHDAILYSLQVAMDFSNEQKPETDANAYIDSKRQLRRRWFGSVKFIDQLYLQGLISMRMDFVDDLLRSVIVNSEIAPEKPDEASIEGALILVGTIGHRLQYANETATVSERKPFPLDDLFSALHKVKPFVGSRIRFLIEDVVGQRANDWKPMKTVREDARNAAAEKDKERLLKLRQNPSSKQSENQEKKLDRSEWHQKNRERDLALVAAKTNSKIKYARISNAWYATQVGLIEIQQAKVTKMEQDLDQCNVKTGWYNRNFLYIFRDFQKLFPTSKDCPVKAVIKECGIWSSSKGRSNYDPNKYTKPTVIHTDISQIPDELRQNPTQNPSSKQYTISKQQQRLERSEWFKKKRERESAEALEEKSKIKYASKIPDELLKPLHKADHPWKLEKINDDSDDARKELLIRQARALLNKITATTEESLTDQFLEYKVYESSAIKEIVSIIVNHAQNEPKYCELFSRFALAQCNIERKDAKSSVFHEALVVHVEEAFQLGSWAYGRIFEKKSETDEQKQADSLESLNKLRSRRFGMSLFIGQLHAFRVIKHVFASSCVLSLLSSLTESANGSGKPDEASVECALGLLRLSGHRLQEYSQRASSKAKPFSLKLTFTALRGAKSLVSNRIRFLIMDLEEQHTNGWMARVSTRAGPEPIDETKKERKTKKGKNKEDESDKNGEKVAQKKGRYEKSEKQKKSIMAANKSLNWRRN